MYKESVLIADVGGTNVRFGIFKEDEEQAHFDKKYPVDQFKSFEDAISTYLTETTSRPTLLVVGAAGNIDEVHAKVLASNTPWNVDIAKVKSKFPQFKHARLVNDFALQGWAVSELQPTQYRPLFGQKQNKNLTASKMVVVGLGTGCGTCLILKEGKKPQIIFTSESGHSNIPHVDFFNKYENNLRNKVLHVLKNHYIQKNLADKSGMVVEHIISGTGVSNVFHALRDGKIPSRGSVDRVSAESVEKLAQSGDEIALKTFDFVFAYLGAHAGSIASTTKADGIFFCGGLMASDWVVSQLENTTYFKTQLELRAGMTSSMKNLEFHASTYRDMAELGAVVRAKDLIDLTKEEETKRSINKDLLSKMSTLYSIVASDCPHALRILDDVLDSMSDYRRVTREQPNTYRVHHHTHLQNNSDFYNRQHQ